MNYVENRIMFKDGNVVVFIDKDKKNHLLLRPGQTLTLDNLGTPKTQKIVYRELKINYSTWLMKIHMTSKEETAEQENRALSRELKATMAKLFTAEGNLEVFRGRCMELERILSSRRWLIAILLVGTHIIPGYEPITTVDDYIKRHYPLALVWERGKKRRRKRLSRLRKLLRNKGGLECLSGN